MDWNKGLSAKTYVTLVDASTWRDIATLEITGGSISRSDSTLLESATIDCVNYDGASEQWIRVWLDARQDGSASHVALFTGLATNPTDKINGRLKTQSVECYSVLKPASDVLLQRGYYAPAGVSGTILIKQLLEDLPAPIVMEDGAPALSDAIVAEDGETKLSMAEKILDSIGYRFRIEGDGTIYAIPTDTSVVVASFDAIENDSIEPELELTNNWYECPNVFRAVSDDLVAVARDDSIESPLSTVNRGREVWMEETDCDLADNESIESYAARRLSEEQAVAITVSYSRRFHPDVKLYDVVRLHYPEQGIDGTFQVTSQSITLGYGLATNEEVQKIS